MLPQLKNLSASDPTIVLQGYLQPSDLVIEMSKGGVGCLVSSFEQWGVVVHEYCSAGLPLLVTREVGSGSSFAIDGYNSLIVSDNSEKSLRHVMLDFCSRTAEEITDMSDRSRDLSSKISLHSSCGNFLSIFSKGAEK